MNPEILSPFFFFNKFHKLFADKQAAQASGKDGITHPKKELTSTPLVRSSSGTDSSVSASGVSDEGFLDVKKA